MPATDVLDDAIAKIADNRKSLETAIEALYASNEASKKADIFFAEALPLWQSMPSPTEATEDDRSAMRQDLTYALALLDDEISSEEGAMEAVKAAIENARQLQEQLPVVIKQFATAALVV